MSLCTAQWKGYFCYAFLLMLAANFLACHSSSASWWSVGVTDCGKRVTNANSSCPNCAKLEQDQFFNAEQARTCRSEPAIRDSLSRGARAAIIDCQRRFNESRWNCSTLFGDYLFGAFVATFQTRETGVLNSYFAAGAVSAIAEDCHNQRIATCPCSIEQIRRNDGEGNIIFETCRADYAFSSNFFDQFVAQDIPESFEGQVDQHNINIGKEVINGEITTCRCHGVSGTCTVQTCYKRVPTVPEIGQILFEKYGGAIHVTDSAGEIVSTNPNSDPPDDEDIIFKDNSPDFCKENRQLGTVGVANRECNPNSNSRNACSSTCCNHGHYTTTKIVPVEECKFIWCCDIVCAYIRNDTITEYRCNPPPPTV